MRLFPTEEQMFNFIAVIFWIVMSAFVSMLVLTFPLILLKEPLGLSPSACLVIFGIGALYILSWVNHSRKQDEDVKHQERKDVNY